MAKLLLLAEVNDDVINNETIDPSAVSSIEAIRTIHPAYYPDIATFLAHWNAGIDARQNWEHFSDNFFKLFTESGFVDEAGVHIEEYDLGSLCRFVIDNKETIMPKSFRDSMFAGMLTGALKMGATTMSKGKDIQVNWPEMAEYARPMAEIVLNQVAQSPERRRLMLPILKRFFEAEGTPSTSQQ
ncbi:hypothetical protein [Spirosoma pomorum]